MANAHFRNLDHIVFRANSQYQLVSFERLSSEQQKLLGDLQYTPGFYGLLQPRHLNGLTIKSVDRDTALLFLTLQDPGPLPAYLRRELGNDCEAAITELILDGVLEVEHNGAFVSGSAAYNTLLDTAHTVVGSGVIDQLSMRALQYAQRLLLGDASLLSARLYFFNRVPVSPRWQQQFPSPDAVAEYLGMFGGATQTLLNRHWTQSARTAETGGWRIWHTRTPGPSSPGAITYKLYISPHCNHLTAAFQETVAGLTKLQATSFKVGRDVYGLLRPDKFIAYFNTFDELAETANYLCRHLAGIPAHGVPFTAAIDDAGLLSWGVDPPRTEQMPWLNGAGSWRVWITNQLALALITAQQSDQPAVEPWRFAVECLQLKGVDTMTWTPAPTLWQSSNKA